MMEVRLGKIPRATNLKEVMYVIISDTAKSDGVIKTSRNLAMIVGWAKKNGYNIVNLKEFLDSEKES